LGKIHEAQDTKYKIQILGWAKIQYFVKILLPLAFSKYKIQNTSGLVWVPKIQNTKYLENTGHLKTFFSHVKLVIYGNQHPPMTNHLKF
jgi:hypothetical protein